MKNKYYTPEIEEFHVGFEYEIFEDFDYLPEKSWHPQVYGKNGCSIEEMDYVGGLDMGKFRVKHLDREDIESLGFELTDDKDNIFEGKYGLRIAFQEDGWVNVLVNKGQYYTGLGSHEIVFHGIVKNKSVLKQVLKLTQLFKHLEIKN